MRCFNDRDSSYKFRLVVALSFAASLAPIGDIGWWWRKNFKWDSGVVIAR